MARPKLPVNPYTKIIKTREQVIQEVMFTVTAKSSSAACCNESKTKPKAQLFYTAFKARQETSATNSKI